MTYAEMDGFEKLIPNTFLESSQVQWWKIESTRNCKRARDSCCSIIISNVIAIATGNKKLKVD